MDASKSPVNAAISMLDATKNSQWYVCRPVSVEAAVVAPSECGEYFDVDKIESDEPVVTAFIEAVKSIFTKNAHQEFYWKEVALETEMNISRSVIGYRDTQLESHSRVSLVTSAKPDNSTHDLTAFLQPHNF